MSDLSIKKFVFRKGAACHIPVSGTFELTPRCNLNCEMCYIHMSPAEESKIGTELSTEEWIHLGRKAVDAGMLYLLLTGGEPLLRKDFCTIYTELVQMGIMVSLNTNATLISEEIIRCLSAHLPEKVNVTLYGTSSETYKTVCGDADGYEKALHGIRMLKAAGIPLSINTTFTKNNVRDMEDLVSFAKKENIPIRMASYIFPPVRCNRNVNESCFLSPEAYGRLAAYFDALTMNQEQKDKRRSILKTIVENENPILKERKSRASSCMAGRGAFWITWDGCMLPCGMLPNFSRKLYSDNFINAWTAMKDLMDHTMLPEKCSVCNSKSVCPMCVAVSQSVHNDTAIVPEEMCRFTETYISSVVNNRLNEQSK